MRQTAFLFCGLLPCLLFSSPCSSAEVVPGPRDPVVSRSFVESIWLEHLWLQVNTFRDQPRAMERYVRKVLLFRPADREALKRMIRVTRERGELQWGLALCEMLNVIDPNDPEKNFLTKQIESALKNARLLTPPNFTRLDVLETQIKEAGKNGQRSTLRDIEGQIRELLATHRALPDPPKAPEKKPDTPESSPDPKEKKARPEIPEASGDPRLFKRLAIAYDQLEEPGLALPAWRKAMLHHPEDFECARRYMELLEQCALMEHVDDALEATTPGQYLDVRYNAFVGQILVRNALGWKAIPWLARWCSLSPKNAEAWAGLGEALTSVGEVNQARACWIFAADNSKNPSPYLKKLALLAAEEKNVPETLTWIEKLKEAMPTDDLIDFLMDPSFSNVPQVLYLLEDKP